MESWDMPLRSVVYSSLHDLPTYCLVCFLMLVISGFVMKYLRAEFYQQKATKCLPTFSCIHYLRVMLVGRKHATTSFLELILGVCNLFSKEGMYGITLGPVKYVFLYNTEAVKIILGSLASTNKGHEYEIVKAAIGDGLFISSGSKWRRRRKQVTPSFHFDILDEFFPVFNKQANILVERIDKLTKEEAAIDVVHIVRTCAGSIILETIAGQIMNETEEAEIRNLLEVFFRGEEIVGKRILLPWLWNDFVFYRTAEGKILKKCTDISSKFVSKIVERRKQDIVGRQQVDKSNGTIESNYDTSCEIKKRLPPLDNLLNLHLKDNSVTIEEIEDELLNYMSAGFTTTALAVSWTLYLLGLHQDIQTDVQREVDIVFGDDINKTVTTMEVESLKYLHCCLKEAMRLYPPLPVMTRNLEKDTILNGYEIEKGTSLVIPVYVMHRNSKIFPNPEKFIPDRFNQQNCKNRHSYAYIPFSAGPRNCIGQRFAIYSAMTILSTLLRHFRVEAVEHRDKIRVKFNIVMAPEKIHLKFTRRQHLKDCSI